MARVASSFTSSPPQPDGSRWIAEWHIVNGKRVEFQWLCHPRIDPRSEVNRRAYELSAKVE